MFLQVPNVSPPAAMFGTRTGGGHVLVLVLVLVELLVLVDVELEVEVEVELLVVVVRLPNTLHASLQATWA